MEELVIRVKVDGLRDDRRGAREVAGTPAQKGAVAGAAVGIATRLREDGRTQLLTRSGESQQRMERLRQALRTPQEKQIEQEQRDQELRDKMLKRRKMANRIGTFVAWRAAGSYIQHRQMVSGDAAYNDRLQRNMRLATSGALIVGTGFNPATIALVTASEAVSSFNDYQRYKFNRRLEKQALNNASALAGDISYGRGAR